MTTIIPLSGGHASVSDEVSDEQRKAGQWVRERLLPDLLVEKRLRGESPTQARARRQAAVDIIDHLLDEYGAADAVRHAVAVDILGALAEYGAADAEEVAA